MVCCETEGTRSDLSQTGEVVVQGSYRWNGVHCSSRNPVVIRLSGRGSPTTIWESEGAMDDGDEDNRNGWDPVPPSTIRSMDSHRDCRVT